MSDFEYAQARLQARYGARPDAGVWARLHGIKTFPAYLEAARSTPLKHWVHALHAEDDAHQAELALRRQWRGLVAELAAWLPQPWQGAAHWCAALCDLPALDYLLRGEPAQPWMREDPALRAYAAEALAARHAALLASPLAALAPAAPGEIFLRPIWVQQWLRLWPQPDAGLENLIAIIAAHLDASAALSPAAAAPLRDALRRKLQTTFRRHAFQPAAAFAWLALAALELQQLRGELALRLLFPWAEAA